MILDVGSAFGFVLDKHFGTCQTTAIVPIHYFSQPWSPNLHALISFVVIILPRWHLLDHQELQ